jgi:hypothetical protein
MTIEFNCPNCKAVIAFADKYGGKQAHCTSCQQHFIIPVKSFEKAKKVQIGEERGDPIPGFYRAVFVDSWKLFTNPKNAAGLLFIVIVVVFKFFGASLDINLFIQGESLAFEFYIPLGWAARAAAWGCLFWFYSEMIYATGFDQDELPIVTVGGFRGLVWIIVRCLYSIFAILLVAGLPFVVVYFLTRWLHVESTVPLYAFAIIGLFLLPIAIMNIAVGRDLTLLRPDHLFVPIFRAFRPYLVPVILLGVAIGLQIPISQYAHQEPSVAGRYLLLNVAVQPVFMIAMRSIGLFYRHYSCHLTW